MKKYFFRIGGGLFCIGLGLSCAFLNELQMERMGVGNRLDTYTHLAITCVGIAQLAGMRRTTMVLAFAPACFQSVKSLTKKRIRNKY